MKYILLIGMLSLSACNKYLEDKTINHGNNTFEYSVENVSAAPGPNDETVFMDLKADEFCPNGYERLSQKVSKADGKLIYTWKIRCI